ncbi:exodeoxyribonuclease VII large subunit [Comamonas flocculans]|uniref:Exodeoxyribonuclease 7 large subunit n=1 Tax=Comamonas flocculans TaxID=2597701 RepID=A0A5B8RXX1_9BURK|nr:exodeoxyribonuclease VII large subunit [Comamonas flocculans]QEA14380.1 exodeoxyribonuclease VII large subunit [Comamonas flocculans]
MFEPSEQAAAPLIWEVGALCRAVAQALQARFNPVLVRGELAGFSRAASGHCYFTLKDASGQLRCAMFRRAASQLDFVPRDGQLVQAQASLNVYEGRGDLQLVVQQLQPVGQGALFEQFLRLKARLQSQGLFDAARKRALVRMPRAIGLVTSPGAAALHDVASTLARRAPHLPVVFAPAQVQGEGAAASLCTALSNLYLLAQASQGKAAENTSNCPPLDAILLVRGGGSMEDLWAFNDEQLAHTIVQSPVPLVCGVGHETDFTIADFCADLRAPTPTAAAELVAPVRSEELAALALAEERLRGAVLGRLDGQHQRLDGAVARLGRPSGFVAAAGLQLGQWSQQLRHALQLRLGLSAQALQGREQDFARSLRRHLQSRQEGLQGLQTRLTLLDPQLVLARGYALLSDEHGQVVVRASQVRTGQALHAALAEGALELTVQPPRLF